MCLEVGFKRSYKPRRERYMSIGQEQSAQDMDRNLQLGLSGLRRNKQSLAKLLCVIALTLIGVGLIIGVVALMLIGIGVIVGVISLMTPGVGLVIGVVALMILGIGVIVGAVSLFLLGVGLAVGLIALMIQGVRLVIGGTEIAANIMCLGDNVNEIVQSENALN